MPAIFVTKAHLHPLQLMQLLVDYVRKANGAQQELNKVQSALKKPTTLTSAWLKRLNALHVVQANIVSRKVWLSPKTILVLRDIGVIQLVHKPKRIQVSTHQQDSAHNLNALMGPINPIKRHLHVSHALLGITACKMMAPERPHKLLARKASSARQKQLITEDIHVQSELTEKRQA